MIEVSGVTVAFGLGGRRLEAVRGVSFKVEAGEVFGLVGESGCGKSTLLRAIAGLVPLSDGRIALAGRELGMRRSQAERALVQMVFQDPYGSLNPTHTVDKVLSEPATTCRSSPTCARGSLSCFAARSSRRCPSSVFAAANPSIPIPGPCSLRVWIGKARNSSVQPTRGSNCRGTAGGVVTGLLNGLVVTKIGVNPLVATLGSMSIARGIALVYTEGFSLSAPEWWSRAAGEGPLPDSTA